MTRARRARPWEGRGPIWVTLSCDGDRVDERTVKVEDIEEDIQGRDVLTFTCPRCGEVHRSYRLG